MHRSFPSILTLLLILSAFIVIPLKWMHPDHPLASEDTFDVCRAVQDGPVQRLPHPPLKFQSEIPGFSDQARLNPSCYLPLAVGEHEALRHISIVVTTQRNLALSGNRQKTAVYVDTWLKEASASGSIVTPVEGPWRRGATYHLSTSPQAKQLLADDDGVVLWFSALNLDASTLQAFAGATAQRLREIQEK